MTTTEKSMTLNIAGAQLTVPTEELFRSWLAHSVNGGITRVQPNIVVPRIGTAWEGQGGIYVGVMRGEAGKPDYHLIVPTDESCSIEKIKFGGNGLNVPGAQSEFDGLANTIALCEASADFEAAHWAKGRTAGGFSDFYLPARREQSLMYANAPELFKKVWHWSSTQFSTDSVYAWMQDFTNGSQYGNHHGGSYAGRVVRRLVISSFNY